MKLIRKIKDLNKAIKGENELGFVPTMGSLHKGHISLINTSKNKCKKTLVSIFINPTQFNNIDDYKNYPNNLNDDLKILRKLDVDFVFLPKINQIYNNKKIPKISLKKSQKILCAQFRKGHFEGVLDVLNRFIKLIYPKIMFMGEKDYQQFFLVRNYFSKIFKTQVFLCKTIRSINGVALSSRNKLLKKKDLKASGLIANKLIKLKKSISAKKGTTYIDLKISRALIKKTKENLIKKFNIKIEYLECRNLVNLNTDLKNKPFKLFIAYYFDDIRVIDNF
tara:strand:- start:569 stop:1405 length:837 start_codon:yes stop_codon:yes gene_type:complete